MGHQTVLGCVSPAMVEPGNQGYGQIKNIFKL